MSYCILGGGHTQIIIIINHDDCKPPLLFLYCYSPFERKKVAKWLSSPAFRSLCASFNSSSSRAQRPFSAAMRCSRNRQSSSRQKSRRLVMARWCDTLPILPFLYPVKNGWKSLNVYDFCFRKTISLGWLWNHFLGHWKLPKLFLSLWISSSKVNLLGSITACRCWPSRAIADANETAAGVAGGVTRTWLHKPRHDMNHEIRNPD